MKTYSRRSTYAAALTQHSSTPRVFIRMDETGRVKQEIVGGKSKGEETIPSIGSSSSSPPPSSCHDTTFSDGAHKSSSVSGTSSPPPCSSPPPVKARKPTFAFLKRKRDAADDGAENITDTLTAGDGKRRSISRKTTRLSQMQIDLGGGVNKTCKDCGMEYVPSNQEDAALHKEFHNMNMGGVDLGRGFMKEQEPVERYGPGETVIVVDAKSSLATRRKTMKVLDVVRSDLGATEITEEMLWRTKGRTDMTITKGKNVEQKPDLEEDVQYKAMMYMAGDKCVGLCLAERISLASKVVGSDEATPTAITSTINLQSSSIRAELSTDPMLIGISRVWTSKAHRRKGIATTLLDSARLNFFYGIEVPKKMVAFSQPTDSGGQLARKWYEAETGWHVYTHSD